MTIEDLKKQQVNMSEEGEEESLCYYSKSYGGA